jgi:hypothetical protein
MQGNVIQFRGREKAKAVSMLPADTTLNRLTQALQAVLFLEGDREGAKAILGEIAKAVDAKAEAVAVTDPAALAYRRYFDFKEEGWLEAHTKMYAYTVTQ